MAVPGQPIRMALNGRKLTQGILMERHGLAQERPFGAVRRYSQDPNLELRQLAEYLVSTRRFPQPRNSPHAPPTRCRRRGCHHALIGY